MRCSRWWGPCLALLILVPFAPAQEKSPLDVLPVQCPIVIQVRGFERTKGRLVTLINNALPDLGKRLQESLEDTLKSQLGERQLKGLAPFGPVVFFFTEVPRVEHDTPPAGVMVRVTDAAAFRNGFFTEQERKTLKKENGLETLEFAGQKLHLLEQHGYVIFSPNADSLKPFVKVDKTLRSHFTEDAAKRMQEADLGVYVHAAAVYQAYGQTLRDARQFIDLAMQQGAAPGIDKGQMEMFKGLLNGAFQGFEDSRHFLLTADFRPEGVALHARVTFGPETKTNQLLKPLAPGDLKAVAGLPAGQMSYTATRADLALNKTFTAAMMGVFAEPGSKQAMAVEKALQLLDEAGPLETLSTADLRQHGIAVNRYKDAAKAAQAQLQLFQVIAEGKSYNNIEVKKAAVKPEAQKHRGFTLHHAEMTWDFEKMAADLPGGGTKEFAEAMQKMMGEGIQVWFGTDGKAVVQVTGKDWAGAQKTLDDYLDGKSGVGQDPSFQEARKNLPSEANILGYYDVPQMMEAFRMGFSVGFQAAGLGGPKFEPSKEKAKPNFLGAAIILKPEHAGIDLWIPAAAAREVQKMIEPLMGIFGG